MPAATPPTAALLRPNDDVATALQQLAAGTRVRLVSGAVTRDVVLAEDVPLGHKFAVRALAEGLRVRKYGELIGRTTRAVAAGGLVHVHNLATSARRHGDDESAWLAQAPPANGVRGLGSPCTAVGESPVFDVASGRLWWIDVRDTPAIHSLDLATGAERSHALPEDIGTIALAGAGRLVAGLRSGFAFVDCATGARERIIDPEAHLPHTRMNDGKCDAAGRFWCGSMNPESALAEGTLYVLDTDLTCRAVAGDWLTPNGIAWSLDDATMYIADTRRGLVYAYAYDLAAGALGERRVFADLGALPGGPDGATLDAEGFLWSASWEGGCLVRFAPSGRMDRVVRLPVAVPTSCAFGGADLRTLFVTTATRPLDARQRQAQPLSGRVLALDVGVAGLPPRAFRPADAPAVSP